MGGKGYLPAGNWQEGQGQQGGEEEHKKKQPSPAHHNRVAQAQQTRSDNAPAEPRINHRYQFTQTFRVNVDRDNCGPQGIQEHVTEFLWKGMQDIPCRYDHTDHYRVESGRYVGWNGSGYVFAVDCDGDEEKISLSRDEFIVPE
jgi:hypothetical protein